MASSKKHIPPELMEAMASRFRALGEVSRLKIVRALMEGDKNVGQLVAVTGLSQPNVSRHLNTLSICGLVARRKEGLSVFYSIADSLLGEICALACRSISD